MIRPRDAGLWIALVALLIPSVGAEPPSPAAPSSGASPAATMPFHRVRVPAGRLGEVPLGGHRLVPVPLEEFEAALSATEGDPGVTGAPRPGHPSASVVREATCSATLAPDGRLLGTSTIDLAAEDLPAAISLGMVPVLRGAWEGDDAGGEVTLHGGVKGLGCMASRPGRYRFQWELPPPEEGSRFVVPLLPALRTRIDLGLPAGMSPLVEGEAGAVQVVGGPDVGPTGEGIWRIDVGPRAAVAFTPLTTKESPQQFGCWQRAVIGRGEVRVTAVFVPTAPWRTVLLAVDADPRLSPESVTVTLPRAGVRPADIGPRDVAGTTAVRLPAASLGTMAPVTITAVAPLPMRGEGGEKPAESGAGWLPLVWPIAAEWAGGGIVVECDPGLALVDISAESCLPVAEEKIVAWPIVANAEPAGDRARVSFEAQAPQARVRVGVAPRGAELDVARVTTVDIGQAVVTARAACDLRVRRGEAFEVTGRVAPGWFIDSVEAVEWRGIGVERTSANASLDWRMVRDLRGDLLRIGFPTAATPQRGFTLAIAGHRAGITTEVPFTGAEMDMLRLDGETAGQAVLAFTSPPETTIEIDPPAPPPAALPERLAGLTAKAAIRAWIPIEDGAMAAPASLLERRPPVEADTRVRLTVLDDRITESFTFSCTPGASALDAVVVHFSEPTDDLLEWLLLPPAGGSLAVRRIDRRGEGGGSLDEGESWLVELQPPVRGNVRIRAARAIPFGGPVAVPLAWVDGSDPQQGGVVIVNASRRRPQIVNRRLEELPPAGRSGDDDLPKGTLAEFAFTPPTDRSPAVTPAAEIVPGGRDRDDEARAWVWSEETTCWCHPTGVTEYETRFDIENHGRTEVAVTPPAGVLARGVVIDDVPATVLPDVITGAWRVDLPADRRFIRLVVRSETSAAPSPFAWNVPLASAGIDVPVLERVWQVLLPDGVDIVTLPIGFREVGAARTGWLERLLPVTIRGRSAPGAEVARPRSRQGTIDAGFRERVLVQRAGRGAGVSVRLVHSRWLWGGALLVCLAFATLGFLTASLVRRLLVAVTLAVAGLWLPLPLDGLARAGLWGLAVAALLRRAVGRWRGTLPLLVVALLLAPASAAARQPLPTGLAPTPADPSAAEDSLPVFIVPGLRSLEGSDPSDERGDTALVPEPLYRALSAALGRKAAFGVRIHAVCLRARPGADGAWTLDVDLDADAGGLMTLVQEDGARWHAAGPRVDGQTVVPTPDSDGRRLGVGFAHAGRHRLEVGVIVRPTRAGEVDSAIVAIPFSPRAELVVEGPLPVARGDASVLQVDALGADGLPRRVRRPADGKRAATGFDVSRATRVRLAWAGDGGTRIVDTIPIAESRNDLAWADGGCRLTATYAIDPGDQIVRSLVLRADPRLGAFALTEPGFILTALGGGRFLVDVANPRRGRIAFGTTCLMPLADPVGFFDLPSAWLEGATSDARTTQLEPSAELIVKATLPEDATLLPPRGAGTPVGGLVWRSESGRGVRQGEFEGGGSAGVARASTLTSVAARVSVERRRQPPRGSQRMDVGFAADAIRLRLEARIDALLSPLVAIGLEIPEGCDIDEVSLREDPGGVPAAAEIVPIGVRWRRDGPRRIVVVVQRPRPGVFLLAVAASLHGAPASAGSLPLIRAVFDPGGPLTATWRMAEGRVAIVGGGGPGGEAAFAPSGSVEVAADAPAPAYRVIDRAPDEAVAAPVAALVALREPRVEVASSEGLGEARVEFAETHLAIDARGRAWGVSRFDVVAADPLVRIRIPAGMRMFDVFVDGRIANDAIPARSSIAENAWELRLLDVGWPRSIVAVYAGDVSNGLPVDGILEIPEPGIVGLASLHAAWILELPDGVVARALPPTATVDEETMTAARQGAIERLATGFDRAIARAAPDDARRLGDFLRQRRREAVLPLPAAWSHVGMRDSHAAAAWAAPMRFLQGRDAPSLRIVVARRTDASLSGRVITTAVLLLGIVALLEARRRSPLVARFASALLGPWWVAPSFVVVAGGVWVTTLDPTWPGWLAMAIGAALVSVWMPRQSGRWFGWRAPRGGGQPGRIVTGETATRLGPGPRLATGSSASPSGSTVRPAG